MKRYAVLLALAVSLLLVQAAAADVVNGGFETGNFTGWTLSGNPQINDPYYAGVVIGEGYPRTGDYAAYFGTQVTLGFISQAIATTPGAPYTVSFSLCSQEDEGVGTPNQFQAIWDGFAISNQVNIPDQPYALNSFTVTASTALTTLEFGFRNDPYYLLIDDVSVAVVPIPGAVWLLGSGLVGLVGLRRKFKS